LCVHTAVELICRPESLTEVNKNAPVGLWDSVVHALQHMGAFTVSKVLGIKDQKSRERREQLKSCETRAVP